MKVWPLAALSGLVLAAAAYAQVPIGGVGGYRGAGVAPAYHTGQEGDQAVVTSSGDHVDIVFDATHRSFYGFHLLRDGRRVVLPDGVYGLTNRGAIRVSGNGHIVWDAFGVVERVMRDATAHPGTDKG
jgi:hypothetical protein